MREPFMQRTAALNANDQFHGGLISCEESLCAPLEGLRMWLLKVFAPCSLVSTKSQKGVCKAGVW